MCSIDSAPVTAAGDGAPTPRHRDAARLASGDSDVGVVDTSVAIGGVEELLEFVRSSVLAGPRPFSFAFHEQSLR